MRRIDLESWPRRAQFEHFRRMADPFFELSLRVRAPGLLCRCQQAGWSPFPVLVAALSGAANECEALRTRLRAGEVVIHERVHPSWTVQAPDGRLAYARGRFIEDPAAMLASIVETTRAARAAPSMDAPHAQDDRIYLSSLAPLDLLAVRPEKSGLPDDCVPRFFWGRLHDDHLVLAMSLHHALVDGMHLPPFVAALEERLARPLPPLARPGSPQPALHADRHLAVVEDAQLDDAHADADDAG